MVECPLIDTIPICVMPPNGVLAGAEFFRHKRLCIAYIPPGLADTLGVGVVYMRKSKGIGTPHCLGGPATGGPPVILFNGLQPSLQNYRYFVHMLVLVYEEKSSRIRRNFFSMLSVVEKIMETRGINAHLSGGIGLRSNTEVDCRQVRRVIEQVKKENLWFCAETAARIAALEWLVSKEAFSA